MNFTFKEYFYKLYNQSMIIMLLPMIVFLAIYYLILTGILPRIIEEELGIQILLILIPIVVLVVLTIVQLEINKRLRRIADESSLGKKMDLYLPIARRKINSLAWVSFLFVLGFILTSDDRFCIYFGVLVLWYGWQWPSPRKVSRDLKLKGDERKLVITKGDSFRM